MSRAILMMGLLIFSVGMLQAQTISFQGVLLENDEPVTDGNYTLTFRLYDVATGGSSVWMEQQTLSTVRGVYRAELGSVISFSDLTFAAPYWISVQVGDGEEMDRLAMTYSPYAIHADKAAIASDAELLGGAPAEDYTKGVNLYYITADEAAINAEWVTVTYVEVTVDEPALLQCRGHYFFDSDGWTSMQLLLADDTGAYIDYGEGSFANPNGLMNRNHTEWVFPVEAGSYQVIMRANLQNIPGTIERVFLSVTTLQGEDQTETMQNLGTGHPNADPTRPLSRDNY